MSDTRKHKLLGKWNNGYQDTMPLTLFLYFWRHNSDRRYYLPKTRKLKEKIQDDEMKKATP